MSGGGGTTVQSQDPWSGVQPYLRNLYRGADQTFRGGGPQYFPGQTFVDPTEQQLAPWNYGFNFMNSAFGGGLGAPTWGGPGDYNPPPGSVQQPAPWTPTPDDPMVSGGYGGYSPPGSYGSEQAAGYHGPEYYELLGSTGGRNASIPNLGSSRDMEWNQGVGGGMVPGWTPGGPPRPPTGGFGSGIAPQYGNQVAANQAMLTGQTPTAALLGQVNPMAGQALARGFGAPISVIGESGFDSSLGDPRGAFQQMLSGQPNYDMVQDAVRAGAQPTLDILREDIMPGLRSRTVGTNNATGEIKELNRIVPRVMRDITNAGTQAALGEYNRALGSRDSAAGMLGNLGMGLGQMGLSEDIARQGALESYRGAGLGLGGLGASLGGQFSSDMAAGVNQFGNVLGTGMAPMGMMQDYGNFTAGFENQALQDAMNRWNYQQQLPMDMANWYSGILSGAGGLGGTTTSRQNSDPLAMAGGMAMMALPFMLSDRRMKRDIVPIGGGWYKFRYVWGEEAVGVMADEHPLASFFMPSGLAMVDYSRIH